MRVQAIFRCITFFFYTLSNFPLPRRYIYWSAIVLQSQQQQLVCAKKSYLALPNGLERGLGPDEAEVILGEERGLGVVELAVERGISSSLRLVICGVGGLEVLAIEWKALEVDLAYSNQTIQRT